MQTKTEVYRRRLRFQCMIFCALLLVGCAGIHVLGMLTPDGNGAAYGKADFPTLESCEQTVEKLPILPGEPEETELFVIRSGQPGPCIFVVGGIHGDEAAGWMAAERLQNQAVLASGTLCILSPANRTGAQALKRYVVNSGDLNRAFPGEDSADDPAMRLAASIFHMIGEWKPNLVLDLHESKKPLGAGGLGYSLIFSDDKLTGDLIWELLLSNEEGGVCRNNFGTAFPGVSRSLNRVVTEQLNYPVITVETLRSDDLEERISEQLSVVGFFLDYFGLFWNGRSK